MTEQEWMDCTDPTPMFEFLRDKATTDRKMRLFACACSRHVWNLMDVGHCERIIEFGQINQGEYFNAPQPDVCHKAVELAERSVDGPVSQEELHALSQAAQDLYDSVGFYPQCYSESWGPYDNELIASGEASYVAHCASSNYATALQRAIDAAVLTVGAFDWQRGEPGTPANDEFQVRAALSGLLREVIGNPFRPVNVDPRWLTSTVVDLARTVYDERSYNRMPILADALMDAGCDSEAIIAHCRQNGEHVRGCWVVDLLLGKP